MKKNIKIDKGLIEAYKFMLMSKLQDSTIWYLNSSKTNMFGEKMYVYEYSFIINNVYIKFLVMYDNTVELRIDMTTVHKYSKMRNPDMYMKVLKFRKMKKNEDINTEKSRYEELLHKALPEDYKRAVKLNKIRNKI